MDFFRKWLLPWSRKLFLALALSLTLVPAQAVFAANECECFCGTEKDGAKDLASKYGQPSDCAAACKKAGQTYVGCYTNPSFYPESSDLCWSEKECTTNPIDVAGETYYGVFSGVQSPYCKKGQPNGDITGYCYGPIRPITLSIPILGTTEVRGLGTYVELVYRFTLPVAALIAVLFFVIAGFQYMTAGGSKKAVTSAKERMQNTVIGLVLLLSVYVIANLLDPRLVKFTSLRTPLIKEAVLLDNTVSCETYRDTYGYTVSPASGKCGDIGTLTDAKNVKGNFANPPEVGPVGEGDTCVFGYCNLSHQSCVIAPDKSGGVCAACAEVSESSLSSALVTPSEYVCSALAKAADEKDDNPYHSYTCYYDDDILGNDECVQFSTKGQNYIDCFELSNTANELGKAGKDGCDLYETIEAEGVGLEGSLAYLVGLGSADSASDFQEAFKDMCESDVCTLAIISNQGKCNFVDKTWVGSTMDALGDFSDVFDTLDSYGCAGDVALGQAEKAAEEASAAAKAAAAEEKKKNDIDTYNASTGAGDPKK